MKPLKCETLLTHPDPNATIIWLHGLGASGHDFVPIVPELALPPEAKIRFIFPHAPQIPVTINGGAVMPAWYDLLDLSVERKIDYQQIQSSADSIRFMLQQEIEHGISSERIIVAGFSQGGAVAYEAALSFDQPLGGLMILSSYFPTRETVVVHPANRTLPISIYHGNQDCVVPVHLGQLAFEHLSNRGFKPEFHSYSAEHSVHPKEVKDISEWIQSRLL